MQKLKPTKPNSANTSEMPSWLFEYNVIIISAQSPFFLIT